MISNICVLLKNFFKSQNLIYYTVKEINIQLGRKRLRAL